MYLYDNIRPTSADENIHIYTDNANKEKQKEFLYGKSSKENTHCFCTQWVQSHAAKTPHLVFSHTKYSISLHDQIK